MSTRAKGERVAKGAKVGTQAEKPTPRAEAIGRLSEDALSWPEGSPVSMTGLMDWALEQSRNQAKAAARGVEVQVGFNVGLQLKDGSVLLGGFVDWAVKSEEGRAMCVAKLGEWVREHEPKYLVVFCDMKTGRALDAGAKMAVIGASEEAAWARIYDMRRLKSEGRIAPERDGPADGIWVDAFQQALHGSKRLAA